MHLSRRNRRGLLGKVVELVEVGLDVAVGERLALLDAEHLAHRGIRVDRVTLLGILELVRVDIGAKGARDVGGRHLEALGLAEERGELVLERDGGREDGGALDGRGLALDRGGLDTTAATAGLLNVTGDTLGELGEGLEATDGGITDTLELRHERVNVLRHGRDGGLDRRGGNRRGGGGLNSCRGRNNRSGRRRSSGLLLGGLLGRRGSSRRRRRNRRSGNGGNSRRLLLGNLLGSGGGGGLGGRAHCTGTGGNI